MARGTLTTDAVVDITVRLIDEHGPADLTLSKVAAAAGVATPSLYKHVRGLAELRSLVSARIIEEIAERVGAAVLGRAGDDAVRACMTAWRGYAQDHPHRYAAMIQRPEEQAAKAGERLLNIVSATLHEYRLDPTDTIHAVRCLRAALHGFAVLEAEGGFGLPQDLGDSFELMIEMVIAGLRSRA
jgi:AcrR family transcriptional regulator